MARKDNTTIIKIGVESLIGGMFSPRDFIENKDVINAVHEDIKDLDTEQFLSELAEMWEDFYSDWQVLANKNTTLQERAEVEKNLSEAMIGLGIYIREFIEMKTKDK